MRFSIYLLILLIVIVWYAVVPLSGGFFIRYKWRKFRNQFTNMRLSPFLDYRLYRHLKNDSGVFCFIGEIESITDTHTLWIKGKYLTIPVSLEPPPDSQTYNGKTGDGSALIKTKCYLLPKHEGEGEGDAPEQIRWNRVSTLSEGIKVFVGGQIKTLNNRFTFLSTKEKPLTVIFYSCSDEKLTNGIIRAARTRNEYWNSLTPISLAVGALSLIYIAALYLDRPAYFLTFICAFAAVFIPIFPFLPPGLIFTVLYRRFTWYARKQRVNSDLSNFKQMLNDSVNPDLFARDLLEAKRYTVRAYSMEAIAWALMFIGVAINIIFMFIILNYFRIISF